jgi:hypothetical protein
MNLVGFILDAPDLGFRLIFVTIQPVLEHTIIMKTRKQSHPTTYYSTLSNEYYCVYDQKALN